jgi:dUTP pyrophosphatase
VLIYLSHPIDLANNHVAETVQKATQAIEHELAKRNAHLFKPGQAFWVSPEATPEPTIEKINRHAQDQASGLIVLWPKGSKSWGVPVEVERALENGQPVAFLTNQPHTWAMPGAWAKLTHPDLFKTYPLTETGVEEATEWVTEATRDLEKALTPLPFLKLNENGFSPSRAYPDDAGLDLYVSQTTTIKPGQFVDIPCSVAVQLNSDTWAMLTGRSSTLRKHGLMVNQGIIDPGYRGELYAGVFNLSRKKVTIFKGDRVAQLILMPNWTAQHHPKEVAKLDTHPRGNQGFGSSGR